MILTISSKILGFARDIILSYFYGASSISDAYLISLTVPLTIFAFIGSGISTNYIPMYSSILRTRDVKSADKFTSNIINFVLILCTIIVLIVTMFTVPVVKLFASGFEGQTLNLAVNFTRISILGIYFSGLIYIFNGYLQLNNNFVAPSLIGIPSNIVIIIFIVLSIKFGAITLPIGGVLATAFQLLFLVPFVWKKGYRYSLKFNRNDVYLKQMLSLSLPVIIGISVNEINVLVDRTIASRIVVGGISALTYANRLNVFIQGIFVISITTAMYPMISRMSAENNLEGLKRTIVEAMNGINLLVIPTTIGSMIFAKPIVTFLFGRGAFDLQAISMTSESLFFYSIGMVAYGLREVISRTFFSIQDTKTPMVNAAVSMIINIILNILLSKIFGIGGLALATSISAIFCTILLLISLRKKIGPFGAKKLTITFMKTVCASIIMGCIANISYKILLNNFSRNLSLFVSIGIGVIVYFIIIYFMKIEDVDTIINTFKTKRKRLTK